MDTSLAKDSSSFPVPRLGNSQLLVSNFSRETPYLWPQTPVLNTYIHTYIQLKIKILPKKKKPQKQRDPRFLKSFGYSYRGPRFTSRQVHNDSEKSVTPVPGDLASSWPLQTTGTHEGHIHVYM